MKRAILSPARRLNTLSLTQLPRAAQLNEAQAFARAMQRRPVAISRMAKIHFVPSPQLQSRVGMVVPKKLLRTSIRRNTAKRQIRESFRLHRAVLPGGDYVVRIVSNAQELTAVKWGQRLREELNGLWPRLAQAPVVNEPL